MQKKVMQIFQKYFSINQHSRIFHVSEHREVNKTMLKLVGKLVTCFTRQNSGPDAAIRATILSYLLPKCWKLTVAILEDHQFQIFLSDCCWRPSLKENYAVLLTLPTLSQKAASQNHTHKIKVIQAWGNLPPAIISLI
jgi:hypothetical protein